MSPKSLKRTISLVSYSSIDEADERRIEAAAVEDRRPEEEPGGPPDDTDSLLQRLVRLPRAMGSKRKRTGPPPSGLNQVGEMSQELMYVSLL